MSNYNSEVYKKWYQKNKKKRFLNWQRWYKKNRNKTLLKRKEIYAISKKKFLLKNGPKQYKYNDLVCCRCKSERENLIKLSRIRDGYYYICRKCNKEKARKYRSGKGILNVRKAVYKSIIKHPRKQSARIKVSKAVKSGYIIKPKVCSKCLLVAKVEAHHVNYNRPLDVEWLCKKCHSMV